LKPGSFTFGSGLVIVPFFEKRLVGQTGWLGGRECLVAAAVGMLSHDPVVITATFVGFLVAGSWESLVSTIGIFLLFTGAPSRQPVRAELRQGRLRRRNRDAPRRLRPLDKIAIGDLSTALIAAGNLPVLFRWKLSNLLLVAVTVALGLIALPLLQPTWARVK
jgi:chromate transporter